MSYQDDRQVSLKRERSKQAIALAMEGRWREAVTVNQDIVENFPHDVDAYNRLGKAYMEIGEYSPAREAYSRAVEIEPYNAIARKNLGRLSRLGTVQGSSASDMREARHQQFIEEAGKAGVVKLYRLAPPEVLARTVAGSRLNLKVAGASLIVENSRGEYLGLVEPKHGPRLIRLMGGGNRYTANIISSTEDGVTVIVREVYQDPHQAGRFSFPPKGAEGFRPYASDRIIRRELEYEQALPGEPVYTIIGGDETDILSEDSVEADEEEDEE